MPPRKILFVDDEASLRATLPAVLEQHGYTVTTAATVREALRRMHGFEFDVLVTDLNIGQPGDGFTVASAMRRTQPNCLNIILTGYSAFEEALNAIHGQVDDFLMKPAEPEALVSAIEQKIDRHAGVMPGTVVAHVHATDAQCGGHRRTVNLDTTGMEPGDHVLVPRLYRASEVCLRWVCAVRAAAAVESDSTKHREAKESSWIGHVKTMIRRRG